MKRDCILWCMIVIIVAITGCSSGSGSGGTAAVTVINQDGQGVAGVTVVLGDKDGAMKSTGVSDANGAISFADAPADATVTAAYTCLQSGATQTTYSLDVRYDVNQPVTLHVNDCTSSSAYPGSNVSVLGTLTLHVTNAIPEVTENDASTISPFYSVTSGLTSTQTLTITAFDLQQDGKLSIYVLGRNSTGVAVAYGMAQDITFTDGMTVDISVDKPMSVVLYHVTNLPTSVDFLCTDLFQNRWGKGGMWVDTCRGFSSLSTDVTVSVPYIPGLGDQFSYSIDAFVDSSMSIMTSQYLSISSLGPVSDQEFDFSRALSAPSGLTLTGQGTVTPGATWSELDSEADTRSVMMGLRFATFYQYVYIQDMSPTRTSIAFPELPDSLTEFRPTHLDSCYVTATAVSNGLYRSSSTTYYDWLFLKPALKSQVGISREMQHRQLLYQRMSGRLKM